MKQFVEHLESCGLVNGKDFRVDGKTVHMTSHLKLRGCDPQLATNDPDLRLDLKWYKEHCSKRLDERQVEVLGNKVVKFCLLSGTTLLRLRMLLRGDMLTQLEGMGLVSGIHYQEFQDGINFCDPVMFQDGKENRIVRDFTRKIDLEYYKDKVASSPYAKLIGDRAALFSLTPGTTEERLNSIFGEGWYRGGSATVAEIDEEEVSLDRFSEAYLKIKDGDREIEKILFTADTAVFKFKKRNPVSKIIKDVESGDCISALIKLRILEKQYEL